MSTLSSHLKEAVEKHKAGKVTEAQVLYEEILRVDPAHADALHLLGVTHLQTGKAITAVEYILQAHLQFPERAEYLRNLAEAYYRSGEIEKAIASYRDFLKQKPDDAKVLFRLGCFLRETNETDCASDCFENAVRIQPGFVEARFNLANILRENEEYNLAEDYYRTALECKPDFSQARLNLALCLQSQGCIDQAQEQFQKLLEFDPRNAQAHNNLGNLFREQNEKRKAVEHYREAIELDADSVEARDNLGSLLLEEGEHEEAKRGLTLATEKNERFVKAWVNLGNVDFDLCELDAAQNAYRKAMELDPDCVDAKYNLSLVQLTRGDFRNGWKGYELRRELAPYSWPSFEPPLWQGEPLAGKTILLDCEQGFGDTLQFIRYAKEAMKRDAQVVVRCQPALKELLRRTPGIDDLIADGEQFPDFDCWSPLLSLPVILRTEIGTIPNETPYLFADESLVEKFQLKFANETDFLIGIAWQGNPEHHRDRFRSIPLEMFRPLAELPGVKLVSLQKLTSEQLHERTFREIVAEDFDGQLDRDTVPFMETAAVMKNLDLGDYGRHRHRSFGGRVGCSRIRRLIRNSRMAMDARPRRFFLVSHDASVSTEQAERLRKRFFRNRKRNKTSRKGPNIMKEIPVPVSPGELIDKVTILVIKTERIRSEEKLRNVRYELAILENVRDDAVGTNAVLEALTAELKTVNEKLWEIEDEIRECERRGDFGDRFVALARAVYVTNDERSAIKRKINERLGSQLVEEKSYSDYRRSA